MPRRSFAITISLCVTLLGALPACGADQKGEKARPDAPATVDAAAAPPPATAAASGAGTQAPPPVLGATASQAAPQPATEPPPGRLQVASGGTFDLSLAANPTTGFQWKVQEPLDPRLELVKSDYVPTAHPAGATGPIVGSGGTAHFMFRAGAPGEAKLTLFYARAWEKQPAEMVQHWVVTIQ